MSTDESEVSLTLTMPSALVHHIADVATRLGWSISDLTNVTAGVGLRLTVSSLGLVAGMSPTQQRAFGRRYRESVSGANLLQIAGIAVTDRSDAIATESMTAVIPRHIHDEAQGLAASLQTDLATLTSLGIATGLALIEESATRFAVDPAGWRRLLSGQMDLMLLQRMMARVDKPPT